MEQVTIARQPSNTEIHQRWVTRNYVGNAVSGCTGTARIVHTDVSNGTRKPNAASGTILIVGDDVVSRRRLRATLAQTPEYELILSDTGTARETLTRQNIDLVVLDIQSADADSLALVAEIGDQIDLGLLIISALDNEASRLQGLRYGADDYLSKPCNSEELLLKIAKLTKRIARIKAYNRTTLSQRLHFDSWIYDPEGMSLYRNDGRMVKVSSHEKRLLALFINHPGRVFSRQQLLDALYPNHTIEVFDRAVDSAIARLRRRIEKKPKTPQILKTVYGEGYVFDAPVRRLSVVI